ncbi:MAG TPA: CYCXC family (seleno)protein [Terriglobia bacterium]|nr:CYCXC family (seleno)protein [Terriglobia bacterium]
MVIKKFYIFGCVLALGLFAFVLGGGRIPVTISLAAPGPLKGARAAEEVPPYHPDSPPAKDLPTTLDPMKFPDAITQNAYAMAAKIKPVLYQQPCYCHCDKELGHGSLLDCFTGMHAAVCNVCKWEGIYAYQQSMKKKTPAQIRAGILKGEWKKVDLMKYRSYNPDSDK